MEQNSGMNGKKTFRESAGGEVKAVASQDGNHPAEITGKEISDQTGWYELYIEKNVPVGSEVYVLTFAMDLGALYEKIVAPVKIGEAGYSSVKDQNMNIIMTGSTSFVGAATVRELLRRGHTVTAIVRPKSSKLDTILEGNEEAHFIRASSRDGK